MSLQGDPPETQEIKTSEFSDEVLANHEAGHVVAKSLRPGFYDFTSVSISSDGETPGSFRVKKIVDMQDADKELLANEMIGLMSGYAAEELVLGEQSLPLEKTSDFYKAYQTATTYIERFGIPKNTSSVFSDNNEKPVFSFLSGIIDHFSREKAAPTEEEIENAKYDIIYSAFDHGYNLLENNRLALGNVAQALLDQRELSSDHARSIVSNSTQEARHHHDNLVT